jgi:hypothetical protein
MVCTIALANWLCHRMGIHSLGVATKETLPCDVYEALRLEKSQVTQMVRDLPCQLDAASEIAMLSQA